MTPPYQEFSYQHQVKMPSSRSNLYIKVEGKPTNIGSAAKGADRDEIDWRPK